MEDFIYLIILIAWVGYAFYRQSQKKKAAKSAQQPSQGQGRGDTMKSLEEILFGKGSPAADTYPEYDSPEEYTSQESYQEEPVSLEQHYMTPEIKPLKKLTHVVRKEIPKPILLEEEGNEEETTLEHENWLKDFDLRKAVIYAEILNRPYD